MFFCYQDFLFCYQVLLCRMEMLDFFLICQDTVFCYQELLYTTGWTLWTSVVRMLFTPL